MNPYKVIDDFERALSEYTGAPYVVCVNSCTAALMLSVQWCATLFGVLDVEIPRRTYVSVPNAITHAVCRVRWRDEEWKGAYQLRPLPVWDCARRFTSGMYVPGQFQCVSFASNKILGMEQGGAILHDNAEADAWFRKARFDGREPGKLPQEQEKWDVVGHHCPMLPSVAAQGILRLHHLPRHNPDMPDYPYPDLSKFGLWD